MARDDFIMLKHVRVSFPHLFTRPEINGDEGKCGAVLMLDKQKDKTAIAEIRKEIAQLQTEALKGQKLPEAKVCLRDGDTGRPEYEGYFALNANHRDRPMAIATDGKTLIQDEAKCVIYAGCHVNAKVRLWAQNNNYGKRVNAELVAVQFSADGEPLDGSHVSLEEAVDGFESVNDDEDLGFDDSEGDDLGLGDAA